jgi:hypothetical protein
MYENIQDISKILIMMTKRSEKNSFTWTDREIGLEIFLFRLFGLGSDFAWT